MSGASISGPVAMIEARGLVKHFGTREAVRDVSLVVPRGEVFGLLGHNGAGKSTLIGMMLGQIWPTAGTVRIGGHDVARHRRAALSRVGAIFEAPAFYDYLSGWRNLEILSHYTSRTSRERLAEVVEWVGLTGREHSPVRTYSHGMRARLALAQALLPDPELLILDEPGDGLDPEGIHELRGTIQRLRRDLGLTILLSSHLLPEVEQLCTRIAVIRRGSLMFEGTLEETRSRSTWVRLRTDRFSAAAAGLRAEGLIGETDESGRVVLGTGVGVERVVVWLVEHGYPVWGIHPEVESLEDFYLRLMGKGTN